MSTKRKLLLCRRKKKNMSLQSKRRINPELIQAARAAKLIRTICCCGPIIMKRDRSRFRQLSKFILQHVISSDKLNTPGQRRLLNGKLQLLEQYELDQELLFSKQVKASYTCRIDQSSGKMSVYFPSFIPCTQISCPDNATHCRIIAVGAALNFNYYNATINTAISPVITLRTQHIPAFTLNLQVSPKDGQALFLILGITYFNKPSTYCNQPPICPAVKIVLVGHDPDSTLHIPKSKKMHVINFDEARA